MSLLSSKETLSKDRLKRVQTTSNQSQPSMKTHLELETRSEIGLFQDVAILIKDKDKPPTFIIGRIIRMRKKGNRSKLEYVRPFSLNQNEEYGYVELLLNMYSEQGNMYKYTDVKKEFLVWNVAMGVSMVFDASSELYKLDSKDELDLNALVREEECKLKAKKNKGKKYRCQNIADDGTRVTTVEPSQSTSGVRHSSRKRKVISHDIY